jgi:hypothetical protein
MTLSGSPGRVTGLQNQSNRADFFRFHLCSPSADMIGLSKVAVHSVADLETVKLRSPDQSRVMFVSLAARLLWARAWPEVMRHHRIVVTMVGDLLCQLTPGRANPGSLAPPAIADR